MLLLVGCAAHDGGLRMRRDGVGPIGPATKVRADVLRAQVPGWRVTPIHLDTEGVIDRGFRVSRGREALLEIWATGASGDPDGLSAIRVVSPRVATPWAALRVGVSRARAERVVGRLDDCAEAGDSEPDVIACHGPRAPWLAVLFAADDPTAVIGLEIEP